MRELALYHNVRVEVLLQFFLIEKAMGSKSHQ